MFKPLAITKDIYYVGVNDRTKHLFENLWTLPKGVSYNSYIVKDEKIALIDTVDVCYANVFFDKIRSTIGDQLIDYLVINHMEPDHTGSLELLLSKYPDIKIIGNARTTDMLAGFYSITENIELVKDKVDISLGNYTLQFYMTPMVHWPETMMTYIPETETLFSGDAFGTYGTLDGGVLDADLNTCRYWDEMIRYYATIVGKYGAPVQKALGKLSDISLKNICSTHGPVWTQPENIEKVVSLYDRLSKYEGEKGLVIAYGSMYGNNEAAAEVIAAEAAAHGIKNIVMHNLCKSHESDVLRDIFKYNGLIIGSPTYNGALYPAVETLLSAIENRGLKNRFFGFFGGFAWAGVSVKLLKEFAEKMNFEVICESVQIKQSLNDESYNQALALGKAMAEKLNSNQAPTHIKKTDCL